MVSVSRVKSRVYQNTSLKGLPLSFTSQPTGHPITTTLNTFLASSREPTLEPIAPSERSDKMLDKIQEPLVKEKKVISLKTRYLVLFLLSNLNGVNSIKINDNVKSLERLDL